jgi:hypothetical protein
MFLNVFCSCRRIEKKMCRAAPFERNFNTCWESSIISSGGVCSQEATVALAILGICPGAGNSLVFQITLSSSRSGWSINLRNTHGSRIYMAMVNSRGFENISEAADHLLKHILLSHWRYSSDTQSQFRHINASIVTRVSSSRIGYKLT